MKCKLVFLIFLFILSGCSSANTIPKEFVDFIPESENEFYVVGYEDEKNTTIYFKKSIDEFKEDQSVSGLIIYYKVDDSFRKAHEKMRFNYSSGFIILEKDKTPYYVESYNDFLDKKSSRE